MDISIIIPAHNEENRLTETLVHYSQLLWKRYQDQFEIIVVANGCVDRTVQIANDLSSICQQIKVIDIPQPVGKGGAVLEGFRQASGQRVLFTDADGATSADSLILLVDELDSADIAIGSRWLQASRIQRKQPIQRRIFSRLFNFSVRYLLGLPYRDTQCGAKAFRRIAAVKLATVIQETHWTIDGCFAPVGLLLPIRAQRGAY